MRHCIKLLFLWALLGAGLTSTPILAQTRYWIEFKDKPSLLSNATPDQWTNSPVASIYLDSLRQRGFQVSSTSKWLNAAAVLGSDDQIQALASASYVQKTYPIHGYFETTSQSAETPELENLAVTQMQPAALLKAGLSGKGVKIGVIDAGFSGAKEKPELQLLFQKERVKAFRDFVNPGQQQFYTLKGSATDNHGTEVLMGIAGYDSKKHSLTGLAPEADYYLARTDDGDHEGRVEEEYFVQALEWLDSLGVKLVNSSLGYATGFDNPAENYTPAQMDGTSLIARAAQIAVEQKGMTLIISAGNDGNKRNWQIINTPADAPGVLAVGSTNFDHWSRQGYSGIGPDFLPYLKPDVACYSATGTSFSAPVITGLAACLLQQNPTLTPLQLTTILRQSGHLYPYGNNYIGFGVPIIEDALQLTQGKREVGSPPRMLEVKGDKYTYKRAKGTLVPAHSGGIVLFRKKSATQVIQQQELPVRTRKIVVKRLPQETHTTLQVGPEIIELIWK